MHARVLVIGSDAEQQLAKHSDRFDWHTLGGRWAGSFVLKPGRTGVLGERTRPPVEQMFTTGGRDGTPGASPLRVMAVLNDGDWIEPSDKRASGS